jgi:hypothetical protein
MSFKGTYKKLDAGGSPLKYFKGDSVLFHGRLYESLAVTDKAPLDSNKNWKYLGNSELYISSNPPVNPVVGQIWATNGKYYSYYNDGNNYAWVEI